MKTFIRLTALALALVASNTALATSFNFSYTFANGTAITGSFNGTANGNLVTGLSNIYAAINGIPFSSTGEYLSAYSYEQGNWAGNPVLSFDGLESNFQFNDSSPGHPYSTTIFLLIPYGSSTTTNLAQVITSGGYLDEREPTSNVQLRWQLSEGAAPGGVGPVPEPETYGMLLAGLGVVSFATRRKRTA